jgi:hypothetical protein
MIVMKNWAVCTRGSEFMVPELWSNYLTGNVYGHPRFNDGDEVSTSSITEIEDGDGCKVVNTRNTEYILYESDVSPDYESKYPNAYNRLSMRTFGCGSINIYFYHIFWRKNVRIK